MACPARLFDRRIQRPSNFRARRRLHRNQHRKSAGRNQTYGDYRRRVFSVSTTSLRFSGAVPPRAEARRRQSYAELGVETPDQRTAPRPLQTRVRRQRALRLAWRRWSREGMLERLPLTSCPARRTQRRKAENVTRADVPEALQDPADLSTLFERCTVVESRSELASKASTRVRAPLSSNGPALQRRGPRERVTHSGRLCRAASAASAS